MPCTNKSIENKEAVGIWQVPPENQRLEGKGWVTHPNPHIFNYDGKYLTLFLITEKDWMWRSEDDYYKLKTEWRGDSLFYQPPFWKMTYLATFKEGKFHKTQNLPNSTHIWVYEKITEAEVPNSDIAVILERKVHDYNIRPTDRIK